MVFVKAKEGPPNVGETTYTVQYFDENGNMTIRSGGKRSWRNNNPGNLISNNYTKGKNRRAKPIGEAGPNPKEKFAVYPDYETGHQALVDMLGGKTWGDKTLEQASKDYSPRDSNHIVNIEKIAGLNRNRKIRSLNEEEFENYWKAIERIEGWEEGSEDFIPRWIIGGVHKKRGTIYEYLVEKPSRNVWIAKDEALIMAKEGRLRAILVRFKNGHSYLRPEYGTHPFIVIA